jgi:hypothetical protein
MGSIVGDMVLVLESATLNSPIYGELDLAKSAYVDRAIHPNISVKKNLPEVTSMTPMTLNGMIKSMRMA